MWPAWTHVMLHWAEAPLISVSWWVCDWSWLSSFFFFFPLTCYSFWKSIKVSSPEYVYFLVEAASHKTRLILRLLNVLIWRVTNKASLNTPSSFTLSSALSWVLISWVCVFGVGVCLFLVFRSNLGQDGAQGIFTGTCSCEHISPASAFECV